MRRTNKGLLTNVAFAVLLSPLVSTLSAVPASDGSGRQAGRQAMMNHSPVWSPLDGRILFDSDRDGDSEIYTIDADTGALRKLTDNLGFDGNARWTPDGKRVVFRSDREGTDRLFQMDPE